MFQFTGFASLAGYYTFSIVGCPIRTPADHIVCADPRGFSQLIASFVASESLGIPHTPLFSLSPSFCTLSLLYSLLKKFVFFFSSARTSPKGCTPCPNMSMNLSRAATGKRFPSCPCDLPGHPCPGKSPGGEYRSRTDDLLRARQAL